jgi:hypothetical protein
MAGESKTATNSDATLFPCCERCIGWQRMDDYTGICHTSESFSCGTRTDSRYRCKAFILRY